MEVEKINLADKLSKISEYWNPGVVGEVNNQFEKLVKFKGEFVWHKHKKEDEMFYVVSGNFTMKFRDREEQLNEGEFIIVPRGIEHKPVTEEEVSVMLFEPSTTLNTGDQINEMTRKNIKRI
jgi:mannose-6-phosphate isomerase-like protein (cupin superfamily)